MCKGFYTPPLELAPTAGQIADTKHRARLECDVLRLRQEAIREALATGDHKTLSKVLYSQPLLYSHKQ